jgi:hypothetical protein
MNANFSSNNIGYNRGVKVHTTGYSPIQASKLITFTPSGTITQPAVASTHLQTQINSIEHKLRIVRRIASRKAAEQKPQANAIGESRLQSRLAEQFNQQIETQLAQSNTRLDVLDQNRVELVRLGLPKPTWGLNSTDSQILAQFNEVGATQFAAPRASNLPKPMSDVVAEIHQSLPINVAETVLGGRTIHSWEMDDLVRQYTPNVPAELQKESEGETWSLTFAEHNPVEVDFANGLATVSLRISKLGRGTQELREAVTISAKYIPLVGGGYFSFKRQGDVNLDFVRSPSGIRAVTLRAFFKGKFDKFFVEHTKTQSATFQTKMPNLSQVTLNNIVFGDGWVQLSLR